MSSPVLWLALAGLAGCSRNPQPKGTEAPAKSQPPSAQPAPVAKNPDTFFAGTVVESTPEKLTVSRVVLGKTERRSFHVTPATRIEGRLRARVRVTVRYETGDGDTAKEIIVRLQQKKK